MALSSPSRICNPLRAAISTAAFPQMTTSVSSRQDSRSAVSASHSTSPSSSYSEGWPVGSSERAAAFSRARGWIDIMEAVSTDMLQVGLSDSADISSSTTRLATDLAEVANLLAEKGMRLAYENWCWAAHAPKWKDAWIIVQAANRPNIGLCLDTFQTAGGEWGDPTTSTGMIEEERMATADITERYLSSLEELPTNVPAGKIFLLQVSDAYNMEPPLDRAPDEDGLRPRGGGVTTTALCHMMEATYLSTSSWRLFSRRGLGGG